MSVYSWVIIRKAGVMEGQGPRDLLIAALKDADLPGVTPPDWIVNNLIADGFANNEAIYRYDIRKDDAWQLTLRQA